MSDKRILRVVVAVLFSAVMACGKSTSPTSPDTSTTFKGVIAGANGQTGTLTITVQVQLASRSPSRFEMPLVATVHAQATSVTATGTLHIAGGSTTSVTGTFDSSSKALNLSGGGFTFSGALSGTVMTGTYSAPGGVTGAFSSLSTTSGGVTAYCGNIFGAGNTSVITGVFNLEVSDATGAVSGAFVVAPDYGYLTGQVTGTSLTISYTDKNTGETGTGTGTVQNGSLNGVSSTNNAFSGSTAQCQ